MWYYKNMKKGKNGFTLIEVIVYATLIGSITATFISFVLMMSSIRNKVHLVEEVRADERFFRSIVMRQVGEAGSVTSPGYGATSSELRIKNRVSGTEQGFLLVDDQILYHDNGVVQRITGNSVRVADLTFENLAATGTPASLQVGGRMTGIASSGQEFYYEEDFNFTVSGH